MNSNTKKLIILVIGIMLLSGILSMVCGFSSLGFSFLNRGISHDAGNTFRINGNYSNIDIESQTGNIRFHDAGKDTAKVVWSGSNIMKLSAGTRSGTLKITEKYRLPWFLRIGIHIQKSEIDVYLPKKDYDKLEIESDTGNINVPAVFSFSDAEIETDTGTIDFQADVRGTLKIETDTGRINCSGSNPEKLELKTDTGSLNLSNIRASGDVSVKTDTGKITLSNTIAGDKLEIKSDTGSIELDHCDAAELDIKSDTGSVRGTLLSEKHFITRSGTGRIDVPESGSGGECKIQTDTGSITIRIEK